MRLTHLILLTVLLPLAWGWLMHWLVKKSWPLRQTHINSRLGPDSSLTPYDFQI